MADLNKFLATVVASKGTALHLTIGQPPKMRVDGAMSAMQRDVIDAETMDALMEGACPPRNWLQFLEEHDLDFAYDIPGTGRFRANYLHNLQGPAAVFKVIPSRLMTMDELQLPPVLKTLCLEPHGLILITGPLGSGRSTTMAAMIDHVNETVQKHVITIENPIEYVHSNKKSIIEHREMGQHFETVAVALQGAMHADPDILLVGDVNDVEVVRLALTCASMGILVFASMETSNATRSLEQLIDGFPADERPLARTLLADSLVGVVSQLLCNNVDGGSLAVHEILLKDIALSEAIRHGKLNKIPAIIDVNSGRGMQSMNAKLKELVATGQISGEEAYRMSVDKKLFRHLLKQGSPLRRQAR